MSRREQTPSTRTAEFARVEEEEEKEEEEEEKGSVFPTSDPVMRGDDALWWPPLVNYS